MSIHEKPAELRRSYVEFEAVPTNTKGGKRRVEQAHKEECDINAIVARFTKTGQLPALIKQNPQYGDFSQPQDYMQAMNTVVHAKTQFEALSAKVRERFNNDPQKFLEFATNPANAKEMVDLGLAIKRPQEPKESKIEAPKKATKEKTKVEPE